MCRVYDNSVYNGLQNVFLNIAQLLITIVAYVCGGSHSHRLKNVLHFYKQMKLRFKLWKSGF